MRANKLELTLNLSRVYTTRRTKRASRAVRYLRELIKKRTHAEKVLIDEKINRLIWMRGIEKPPRKLRVVISVEESEEIKTKTGKTIKIPKTVKVSLPSEGKEEVKQEAA
ncbi:MAG: 50S ribosomal protein L31e [Fervidicoccaceae archaeon]|jgi:large subunit ribosomal protein L31e|uniref:Large ribosomal subunit protein eL31 n=1 Tax=Fervidicoccus fontis TaxID=683846 RepID=A0A7C2UQ08_9CREN|nr:MAG: 50S ribosomal protein L31e [Fervidicoccus sp.]HEU97507.1 50S ribosomal protein L31e [Fervidicoccus fontis]